jgi:hypothetical protein
MEEFNPSIGESTGNEAYGRIVIDSEKHARSQQDLRATFFGAKDRALADCRECSELLIQRLIIEKDAALREVNHS